MFRVMSALLMAFLLVFSGGAFAQQGLFSPVIKVNDLIVTQYEIDQRARLLQLLRTPGDPLEEARKGLIEDRLRLSETRRQGIVLTDEQILGGMEEFAGRANLTAEQFIQAIGREGVAAQTFRDFVNAGLAWRILVQNRFGPRAQVTEAEIDRALALQTTRGGARLLLAEIILPLSPQTETRSRALIQRLSDTIRTEAAFSAAARRYSASPTRRAGGRLEWLPIGQIPPAIRAAVLPLEPGEVTDPIVLGPGIGIFQLRAIEELETPTPETLALEYVTILIPGGQSDAARATAQKYSDDYDTCDDLYKPAQDLPPEYFERVVLPANEVPAEIAAEAMKLDNNEVSTALTRQNGTFLVYLMLCGRTLETDDVIAEPQELAEGEEPAPVVDPRDEIRNQLFQQRIASYANSYLEELRADAIIVEN